jgi:hypothetical protein
VAALDPRDPQNENRTVTVGYLDELYAKADRGRLLELAVRELIAGPCCGPEHERLCHAVIDILEAPCT